MRSEVPFNTIIRLLRNLAPQVSYLGAFVCEQSRSFVIAFRLKREHPRFPERPPPF